MTTAKLPITIPSWEVLTTSNKGRPRLEIVDQVAIDRALAGTYPLRDLTGTEKRIAYRLVSTGAREYHGPRDEGQSMPDLLGLNGFAVERALHEHIEVLDLDTPVDYWPADLVPCPAAGCPLRVAPDKVACDNHWAPVSETARRRIDHARSTLKRARERVTPDPQAHTVESAEAVVTRALALAAEEVRAIAAAAELL